MNKKKNRPHKSGRILTILALKLLGMPGTKALVNFKVSASLKLFCFKQKLKIFF